MPTVSYRLAVLSDADQITDVEVEAFYDDVLFKVIYPRRAEYPADWRTFWFKRTREKLLKPRTMTVVAELPDEETGKERVVGFANWEKYGKHSKTEDLRDNLLLRCEEKLVAAQNHVSSFLAHKDMAVDEKALDGFRQFCDTLEATTWKAKQRYDDRWHLQLLGVHSSARRRGIATELLQWGLRWAKEDGVDAGLEASPVGLPLYLKEGFSVIDEYKMDGVPDGSVLAWLNPNVKD